MWNGAHNLSFLFSWLLLWNQLGILHLKLLILCNYICHEKFNSMFWRCCDQQIKIQQWFPKGIPCFFWIQFWDVTWWYPNIQCSGFWENDPPSKLETNRIPYDVMHTLPCVRPSTIASSSRGKPMCGELSLRCTRLPELTWITVTLLMWRRWIQWISYLALGLRALISVTEISTFFTTRL